MTTAQQEDALVNIYGNIQPAPIEWVGKTMILPFENRYALINEHGSVTYCEEAMLEAHKAGAR